MDRPWLHALADAVGIFPSYHDVSGREHRLDDEAAAALLEAMGFDVSSEAAAEAALERLRATQRGRIIPPASVIVADEPAAPMLEIRVPDELLRPVAWRIDVRQETGEEFSFAGDATDGRVSVALEGVSLGYHRVRVTLGARPPARTASGALIVAPARCWTPADGLGGHRAFGLWCNLYTVRSAENWGIGDFADLRRLVRHAARQGAAFVGVNPLHSIRNRGQEVSPYSPVSRVFRSIAYLAVVEVPEYAESAEARGLVESEAVQAEITALRDSDVVDYDRVRLLKTRVLRVLFGEFCARHRERNTPRGRAFADFVRREGRALDEFATFLALEEHLAREGSPVFWREWPEEYRDFGSLATARFRREHADEIDWHCWIQFELDRQLGLAAEAARTGGMPIGLYQDLAVGTSEGGSDVWSFQHLFDRGVTVGAPPDAYAEQGQDWGLPPLDPNRLREDEYRYWIRLLRAAFRHAGALRIDHAMGLARLYWIPPGLPATAGAYVRYPAEELLAILALESRRHRAVVIAEDLGTVPEGFEQLLERWGILSSRVLWFEREEGGGFRPQEAYPARALVTTTTHDHAPLAAWLSGRDLEVRREIGLMTDEEAGRAMEWRAHERRALVGRLREAGLLAKDDSFAALLAAVYAWLGGTSAVLVGVALDDLTGETEPVNIPGVGADRYPVWSRRMHAAAPQCLLEPESIAVFQTLPSARTPD